MSNRRILISYVFLSILIQTQAGFLDWFRSKPKWVKSIDKYPLIEAFSPKGLRVSIGDVIGMEVFGFHGNLNHCFKRDDNGDFYGNVTKPINGRWVYVNENIELKPDDALHYWIYVKMNGEEYSFSKDVRVIRSLAPLSGDLNLQSNYIDERFGKIAKSNLQSSPLHHNNEEKLCVCPTDLNKNLVTVAPHFTTDIILHPSANTNNNNNNGNLDFGDGNLIPINGRRDQINYSAAPETGIRSNFDEVDSASELLTCSFQVDSLNEVILDLLKDSKIDSKLVLVGQPKSTQISAFDAVHKMLVQYLELYDLGKKIKKAEYLDCGILFEMSSIIDKKRILLRSKTDMRNVPCQFEEPELAGCRY